MVTRANPRWNSLVKKHLPRLSLDPLPQEVIPRLAKDPSALKLKMFRLEEHVRYAEAHGDTFAICRKASGLTSETSEHCLRAEIAHGVQGAA